MLFGVVSWTTLNSTKVNGPHYKQIVLAKDLVADVMPPPEYILEAYLVAYQIMDERDASKLPGLAEQLKTLTDRFQLDDSSAHGTGKSTRSRRTRESYDDEYRMAA